MDKKILKEKIWPMAENAARELGYEIVDIEYKVGSKHDLLSIYIYKKEGIDLEDCSNMTRKIDKEIEDLDLINKPYYLEISSPGLDRPIKTRDDYRRNLDNLVEAKLYAPLDGKKIYEGSLKDYDGEFVYLENDGNIIKLPIKSISHMEQKIVF
ncbi:ribosome maturation factor RimP [Peptoniphilus koenoeneniae]|jgi:hypothetical protein|uniref:Ribosome maturation factor RimP n=1 Tax=Peptoniphilus koenoeneniae TaxID=507751 RepID=A0ABU0AS16_9FIRM|nr:MULTISPECIES: ribosome maturation factor RimP [Peptoniphilus]ERT56768.1 hypothetical protein HMPREF1253_1562 [Peptoniphilus sp. BV3C26]MDQ0274064.1 ribosome maturation factor RimP [Peptoniphilus koenoeneniae]